MRLVQIYDVLYNGEILSCKRRKVVDMTLTRSHLVRQRYPSGRP